MDVNMTHDELLSKIQSEYELNKHFRDEPRNKPFAALRAVVELHKPDDYCCPVCGPSLDICGVEYPCPTIQAIEKELQ
jgi:hypothetical protein